jgi:hypothetical protein
MSFTVVSLEVVENVFLKVVIELVLVKSCSMLLDTFSMFEVFNEMFLLFKEKSKDLSSKFLFTLTSVRLLT